MSAAESLAVGWSGTTLVFQAEGEAELERERDAQRKAITEGLRRMLTDGSADPASAETAVKGVKTLIQVRRAPAV